MENSKKGGVIAFVVIFVFYLIFTIPLNVIVGSKAWTISAVIFFVLLTIISIIISHNKFVSLSQKIKQSEGLIDVYLKQRFDLIPNLVETVKGYAKYEENVLSKITSLRKEYETNKNQDLGVSAELNDRYNQLIAVVENYPELKANEAFLNLQKQLSKTESQLQAARRIYNSDVTQYNVKVQSFPSNIIAKMFGFEEAKLFEIRAEERQNIDINI